MTVSGLLIVLSLFIGRTFIKQPMDFGTITQRLLLNQYDGNLDRFAQVLHT